MTLCKNPLNDVPHELVPNNKFELRDGYCMCCEGFDGWSRLEFMRINKIEIKENKVLVDGIESKVSKSLP